MQTEIIVYEKSTCSKCRQVERILTDANIDYTRVFYHDTPLSPATIKVVLKKLGCSAREAMRTNEQEYKTLKLAEEKDEEVLIATLAQKPDLLQRPIVVKGDRAIIARPAEKVFTIFD